LGWWFSFSLGLLRFDKDELGRITSPIRDCSKFDLGTDSRERERGR
jgi:hypothetical protein